MGATITPSALRGLIIPDPRITADTFDTTNSVYTEGGPRPGDVVMSDESDLVLNAVGTITHTASLEGKTIAGGNPGPDGARFVWRREGDSLWRGWIPHHNINGFRFIDRSTTADKWHPRHIAKLSDGTLLTVSVKDLRQIVCHVINQSTGVATEVEVFDPGSAASFDAQPCLLVLPSGRVLCFFWRENTTLSTALIRMYYSDDDGATWLPGSKNCAPNLGAGFLTASYTPGRLRAFYLNQQVGLVFAIKDTGTPEDWLYQMASNDLGATFSTITVLSGVGRNFPDVVVKDGRAFVFYVSSGAGGYTATNLPYYRIISSVYEDLTDATAQVLADTGDAMEWGTKAGNVYSAGEMAAWLDDDGKIFVAGVDHNTAAGAFYEVMVRYTEDDGDTWNTFGYASNPVAADGVPTYSSGDASTYLRDISVVAWRGRAVLVSRHAANPGTGDDSISLCYLGGYSSVENAQGYADAPNASIVHGYVHSYLPLDLPGNVGGVWTKSTAGAPSEALTALGLHLTSGGGESIVYSTGTLSGTLAEGIEAIAEVRLESGTARLNLRISDATPLEYEVVAQVSTTAITFYDSKAAANIATVATSIANGAHIQVKVAISTASAKMWYRHVGSNHAVHDQDWTLVGSSTTLSSAAVNTGSKVIFGQDASTESYWRLVSYSHDNHTGVGIVTQDNYGDLLGRNYSARPIYLDAGASIRAVDGPTYRNEDWTLVPRFDYPVSNLFRPSPREPWRSHDDSTQVDLEFPLGGATFPLGSLLGIYLGGCNFGTAQLWGKDLGGTWQNLGTLDLRVQTGLKFIRDHRLIRPDTSGGNSCATFFPTNILAGSHIELPWQGEGTVVRKIEANESGAWVASSTTKNVRILLESVTGTESTSGTSASIWLKDAAFIVPINSSYSAFRIRIPVQATYEDYFQIGSLNIGHFHHFAQTYGWGRAMEVTAQYELIKPRSGIRRVKRLAPTRRAVEFDWTDGVDSSSVTTTNPNADYQIGWTAGTATSAVGIPGATLYNMIGVMDLLDGAVKNATYIATATLPSSSTSIVRVVNREVVIHGRIRTETWRMDNVVGDEWTSPGEVHRGSTFRLEEEV